MTYTRHGVFYRFDSVTELLELCRNRHPNTVIDTRNSEGDFVLRVRGAVNFDSLIAHFEGRGCYAVMLPALSHSS